MYENFYITPTPLSLSFLKASFPSKIQISYSFIIVTHMYMCVRTCMYDLLSPFRIAHVSMRPELTDLD